MRLPCTQWFTSFSLLYFFSFWQVWLSVDHCVYPPWNTWRFLGMQINVLNEIWQVFGHCFFKDSVSFSLFLLGLTLCKKQKQKQNCIISINLLPSSLILSSAYLNLLLSPSSHFLSFQSLYFSTSEFVLFLVTLLFINIPY